MCFGTLRRVGPAVRRGRRMGNGERTAAGREIPTHAWYFAIILLPR